MRQDREPLFSLSKEKGDFVIETFCAGGKGGQHQNRTATAVRITHPASGAQGISRDERSQHQNKKLAFHRLIEQPKFKSWLKMATAMAARGVKDLERELERQVAAMMKPENIKVEFLDEDGKPTKNPPEKAG